MSLISKDNLSRFKTNLENTYGTANNPAKLNENGILPEAQLPDSVHDVLEYATLSAFPETGEAGKLYLDKENNVLYRWDSENEAYTSTSTPDAIKYTSQTLDDDQKRIARTNIGAASSSDVPSGVVQYNEDQTQTITGEQKVQARANIGAASASDISGLQTLVGDLNESINNFGNFVRAVDETEGGLNITYDNSIQPVKVQTGLIFNGGYVDENNYLHLKNGDNVLSDDVFDPIQLPAGGGGGGGGTATIAISDVVKINTVRNGAEAVFSFVATASDDTDLSVKWYVDDELLLSAAGSSGDTYSFDAGPYLKPSDRSVVRVLIESEGGASLPRKWNVDSIAFSLEWGNSIDKIMLNTSNTNVYVPINVSAEAGSNNVVTVTVGKHTITRNTTGSVALTVMIDKSYFSAGANIVTASMAAADDPTDKAEDIYYTVIWGTGVTTPIVAFAESTINCKRYDIVDIEYFVFDPNNEIPTYTLKIGGQDAKVLTATRTMQTAQYSPMEEETINIVLTCGISQTTSQLIASASDYNLNYFNDDSLVYNLNPFGHSNSDSDRELFGDVIFSENFDWENGGFKQDAKGAAAFVVKKGNTVTLPRCLFEDSDVNGKTIDISFKVTNSDQYDAIAMQELNGNSANDLSRTKGIILKANNGELRLNNVVGKEFRYCENSRIDLSILVESNVDQRLATIWLDGIPSNVSKYSSANTLVQDENALVIGSEHCDVWVYAIRVYNSHLTKRQMIQNYVSLGSNTTEKVNRYRANTILDDRDNITPDALHRVAPSLTIVNISASKMTVSKSDKVPADITIIDGATVLDLLSSAGTVFMVQGTSSSAYGRSAYNLDIDFKGSGKKYKISEGAIGVNYLNIKVNVASSENANNINAVDWYNTYQPYITEPRTRPGVRDSVEGKPCAVFITNTNSEAVWFSSQLVQPGQTVLYAMGDICNSKKNKAVFGQDGSGEHPTLACVEVSDNDTEPQRFRSTAAQFMPNADDGKGRWETTGTDDQGNPKQIKHFEWRMNPSGSYDDPDSDLRKVVDAWDEAVAWVVSTIDNSAKFKAEVGNYFAIDSLLYHFLFIEYFEAYDNVSKNTFYSYDWDEDAQKYLWNIKAAYDMDTILACDNDGKPFGDYGLDFGDTVNGQPDGRQYFNAADNPIWNNIKAAFQTELSSLYSTLRSRGAWNSQAMITKWDTYQAKRPQATMILDAYNKYIKPYKTTGVIIDNKEYGHDDSYLGRLQGSKTYWRRQFLTYQTSYMDGKYGYYSTTGSTRFRTNCASDEKTFAIKAYAKTYITFISGSSREGTKKVNAGEEAIFNNVSVGNNTTMYITPDGLIQYIHPLNETQNSTFSAPGAEKLMEAILGSEEFNTSWDAAESLDVPSVMLRDLSVRNLVDFSESMNLSKNVELETLDTRGTNAGIITLPSFAPLTTVQLNACTGISAFNLNKVSTFTLESGNNLTSIQVENCNNVVDSAIATYLTQCVNANTSSTKRIRAIDINWSFDNLDILSKVAKTWKGYNALGDQQNTPVVTGAIHVTTLSKKRLEEINDVWGEGDVDDHLDEDNKIWTYDNLSITFDSIIPFYSVEFLNADGSAIKDKIGNDYVQYIDLNGTAYDPIEADEIDTPTMIDPEGQFRYTFNGWSGLTGNITSNRTVTATYTSEVITYTVRWFDKVNGTMYDERTEVPYGTEVIYDPDGTIGYPTLSDEESAAVYKVFTGWDKSTGYVTQDIDVYATWDRAALPSTTKKLNQMSIAEISAVINQNKASTYFSDTEKGNYTDIQVGRDYTFSNVESEMLLQNRYFDGTEILKRDDIKLFSQDAPSFTLAIDYEFTESTANATLVSCCDDSGNIEGFRVYYAGKTNNTNTNESICVKWGDQTAVVAHGYGRGIIVLRHRKGSKNLLVSSDNAGRYLQHAYTQRSQSTTYGLDEQDEGDYNYYYHYDGYNSNIITVELPRTQTTNTDAVLSFGATAVGAQGAQNYAKGWIHWCKIWYADLGRNVVEELACWPHETWRMHYRGNGLYVRDDGTGLRDKASFIANAPLSLFYNMYPSTQNLTTGGWKNSDLRTFVNTKCFKALPLCWQLLIKPVRISTKGGADNYTAIENTSDRMYIPAFADLKTTTIDLLSSEGSHISMFAENSDRVKFMGITIPENRNLITNVNNDPTLYTDTYDVHEGDVWIPSSNAKAAYIYVSEDTASKHGYYGGREFIDRDHNKDNINNIVAGGPNGGVWIRSTTYWTRSNCTQNIRTDDLVDPGNSTQYHYTVYPNGDIPAYNQNAWIYYQWYQNRGVVLMFSIY